MFGFTVEEIQGKSRQRPLVTARQIGMYVFRELTDLSYPAIAREFGGRDHTTVIHAVEKIQRADEGAPPDLRPGHRARSRRIRSGVRERPSHVHVDNPVDDLWTTPRATGGRRAVVHTTHPSAPCRPVRPLGTTRADSHTAPDLADREFVHNPQPLLPLLPDLSIT